VKAIRREPSEPLEARERRPLRVVVFGSGPVLTHDARRFLCRLEAHADISLLGAICQAEGSSIAAVFRDLRARRGVLALPLFAAWLAAGLARWLRHPLAERALRRELRQLRERVHFVTDIHAVSVLERIDSLQPDLGLIYGSPILRPELFEKPRLGTLGIHHGKLPEYRGNKTTFWAMVNGEPTAGVTIQKVDAGLDTGQIVEQGLVGIGRRSQRAVWRDLENLGLDLYVRAILRVGSGDATFRPQNGRRGKLYRNPKLGDLVRFRWMRLRTMLGFGQRERTAPTAPQSHGRGVRSAGTATGPRILIFTETFHPVIGGGETQARLLAQGLLAAGIPARVLTRRSGASLARVESLDDVFVHRIPPAGSGQLKKWGLVLSGLWALLALRRTYDVVFVSGFRILGIPSVLVCKLLGKTAILKADSQGEMSGRFFDAGLARFGITPNSLPFRLLLGLRNRLLERADAFVAITDGVAAELDAAGVDPARVHRIPNAVDAQRFSLHPTAEKAALRRRLRLPSAGSIVVYTGRLVSYKGLPLLTRVWEKIHAAHPDARLVLVGTGGLDIHNCEEELRSSVRATGLEQHVIFTGSVENVEQYLQASDVFVLPSENEALPCSLLEAMACALPVIVTPVGAIPSFLEDGANGLLVEPGDFAGLHQALLRLLEDRELARRLGNAARRTVEEGYSSDLVTRRLLALFSQARKDTAGRFTTESPPT
jgi:glycosyltransferase involved in cell wall biosynthesis/folate-dependent phosphoribosylglycinamide formyltransferase PurN